MKKLTSIILIAATSITCATARSIKRIDRADLASLKTVDGDSVIKKMNHQDLELYLNTEQSTGTRVIKMTVLFNVNDENYYHDKALRNSNVVIPLTTNGDDFGDVVQYDYWDNVAYVVKECEKKGIYTMLSPMGKDVFKTRPTKAMVKIYMNLLSRLLENEKNVIWVIDKSIIQHQTEEMAEEMVKSIETHNKKQLIIIK